MAVASVEPGALLAAGVRRVGTSVWEEVAMVAVEEAATAGVAAVVVA